VKILLGAPQSPESAAASPVYAIATHTDGLCRDYASNAEICPGGVRPRDPEIRALAAGLKNDPDLIYEYVRNSIETEFIFGSNKGPLGVTINKTGSAFDQAYLMVELVRAAGGVARYKFGTISLTGAQFYDWTGVKQAKAACAFLAAGGVPATINGVSTTCELSGEVTSAVVAHVWVEVDINGQHYQFDPAYKPHSHKAAFDVRAEMQFSPGTPLAVASQTVVASGAGVASFNQAGLATTLNTYAGRLASRFEQADMAGGGLVDVIGGEIIVPAVRPVGGLRQTSLAYATATQQWADIPDAYRAKMTLQRRNLDNSLTTYGSFFPDEIFGRRMEIGSIQGDTPLPAFQPRKPELRLDGVPIYRGADFKRDGGDNPWLMYVIKLRIAIDHPFAQAAYGDDAYEREISGTMPIHVLFGIGEVSKALGEKWSHEWAADEADGMEVYGCIYNEDSGAGTCSLPYGDTYRANVAATWMAQQARAIEIHSRLSGAKTQILHNFGTLYSVQGFDMGEGGQTFAGGGELSDITTALAVTSLSADPVSRRNAIRAIAATMAALEGSVPEQLADMVDASSAARRFAWGDAPEAGETVSTAKRPFTHVAAFGAAPAASALLYEGAGNAPTSYATGFIAGLNSYLSQGFEATLSLETALGPGYPTVVTHAGRYQRGGAFVATKYVNNDPAGDPLEIAYVSLSFFNQSKGAGGGSAPELSTAATRSLQDQFKDRSTQLGVSALTGLPSYQSATLASTGQGEAPTLMSDTVGLRGSGLPVVTPDPTFTRLYGPTQFGTTSSNVGAVVAANSALDAMGDARISAMAETLAAFVAMQDVWNASTSTQRDVAELLTTDWWTRRLLFNVATVHQGVQTRRFVKVNGLGFREINGGGASLIYNGVRTPMRAGGLDEKKWDPDRNWSYPSVTLTESDLTVKIYDPIGISTIIPGGAREAALTRTTFPGGVSWTTTARFFNVGDETATNNYLVSSTGAELRIADPEVFSGVGAAPTPCWANETGMAMPAYTYRTFQDAKGQTYKLRFLAPVKRTVNQRPEDSCRLEAVFAPSDPNTPVLQYVYDGAGHVVEARDAIAIRQPAVRNPYRFYVAEGYRGEWSNPANGSYSVETMPAGGYVVDGVAATSLTRVSDEIGRLNLALYDGRHRLLSRANPEKDEARYKYDARDNVVELRQVGKPSPFSPLADRVTTAGWNSTWNKIAWIKVPGGAQTDFVYQDSGDGVGKLRQLIQPEVAGGRPTYTLEYYPNGLLKKSTDPLNVATTHIYDARGNLTQKILDPTGLNLITTYGIDAAMKGDVVSVDGPRTDKADVSYATYDELRRKIFSITPGGTGSAKFRAEKSTYDIDGRLTKVEVGTSTDTVGGNFDPPLQTTRNRYDAVGNKTQVYVNGGTDGASLTQISYDGANRQICSVARMNKANLQTLYDAGDMPNGCDPLLASAGVDGPDRVTQTNYNPAGEVTSIFQALGIAGVERTYVEYTYTDNGKQKTIKDANQNLTALTYDGFDRLSQQNFPSTTRGAQAASTTDYEHYDYDLNGNRTGLRKRDGSTLTYGYDALNRMTSKSGSAIAAVTYGFDLGSQSTSTVFTASGQGVTYTYDAAGRKLTETSYGKAMTYCYGGPTCPNPDKVNATQISWPAAAAVAIYAYDAANRVETAAMAGASVSYVYDDLGRRTNANRASGANETFVLDTAGRPKSWSLHFSGVGKDQSETFGYNAASQLIGSIPVNPLYLWAGTAASLSATADGLNRDVAISTVGGGGCAASGKGYDCNGNLTNDGWRTFAYDGENRLTSMSGSATAALSYDPLGRLRETTINGVVTQFLYDGDQLVGEYDIKVVNGTTVETPLRRYLHGMGTDDPLVWFEGSGLTDIRYLHADRQGSIIAWSDTSGVSQATYTYGPYGEPGDNWAAGSRFRYTGQAALPELKLYHYKARVYDPVRGWFLQTDPVGYKDDLQLYAYVGDDPMNKTDPSGLAKTCTLRENGGQSCWEDAKLSPLGALIAVTATTVWNAGVHGYEKVTSKRRAAATRSETQTRREKQYYVTVQVQGTGLRNPQRAIPIEGNAPVRVREVHVALTALANSLPRDELRTLGPAFVDASKWATRTADNGGIGPVGSNSFGNGVDSETRYRVDIDVRYGEINIVH